MKIATLLTNSSLAALILTAGCQDTDGGGGGGTGPAQMTTGVLTGFGSVLVNGIEFHTAGVPVYIDGVLASQSDLAVGMVVSVTGDGKNKQGEEDYDHDDDSEDDSDDDSDNAMRVDANSEIEGIVLSSNIDAGTQTGSMDVMGQTVVVTVDTVFESKDVSITTLDLVAKDHIVEVSGFSDGNGEVFATRIELEALSLESFADNIEVKGNISSLDTDGKTFDIGSLSVDYSGATVDADDDSDSDRDENGQTDDSGLSNGFFVEVKSILGIDNISGALLASEVEREDDGEHGHQGDFNDHYDIEGIITTSISGSTFLVNGITVIVSAQTVYENTVPSSLVKGTEVEVVGVYNLAGALLATKIELEYDSDEEIQGIVTAISMPDATKINSGTVTVDGNTVTINNTTMMKDEASTPVKLFNLSFVAVNDNVEIRAYTDPISLTLVAVELERKD